MGTQLNRYDEIKEFKPKPGTGREHALTLYVYTDNRECLSQIPNPQSYEEGGPCWTLSNGPTLDQRQEIAQLVGTLEYLLSPEYTAEDAMKRLRDLRAAYRDAWYGNVKSPHPTPPSTDNGEA